MANDIGTPTKGSGEWGQAVTALVLVGALGGGFFVYQKTSSSDSQSAPPAATCPKESPEKASSRVTGAQLCEALNRPDLADLLGTPEEIAKAASSSGGGLTAAHGKGISTPSAQVQLDTYTVSLSASYDHLTVAQYAEIFKDDGTRTQKVLGRSALSYADRTISVAFRVDGGDATSRQGVPARSLLVALDAKDSGGSFQLSLWRADGMVPTDTMLARIAQTVLPTLPRWDPDV